MSTDTSPLSRDRQWFIVGRWQEFEGEGRANLLRIIAIGLFYALQLIQFYGFANGAEVERPFHRLATAVAVVWSFLALGVLICLRQHRFPAALKFVSTCGDILLLTMLAIFGDGPNSPVVLVYFLILTLAALRFSLSLICCATLGCVVGYLTTISAKDNNWFDSDHLVRPVEQLVMVASLAFCGILLGQVIRRVRTIADDFARRVSKSNFAEGNQASDEVSR